MLLLVVLLVSLAWTGLGVELFDLHSTQTGISASGEIGSPALEYVNGDRIVDANGNEVIWRATGASYLLHADDFMTAWQDHLPQIKSMGLNTMRLSFRFPFDVNASADVLNYTKLDQVINFLAQNNIKTILDNHAGIGSRAPQFGSRTLINAWKDLATRYRGDPRIVAYELINEPGSWKWDPSVRSLSDVPRIYANLTKELRTVDPNHIIIWQAGDYWLPPWEEWFTQYAQPNVVYSIHAWWNDKKWQFDVWSPEQISYRTMDSIVFARAQWRVPFWLGEFGATDWPYNVSNPRWVLTEQNLWRCEEQAVGWSLWMGEVSESAPWYRYLPFFPLKVYNAQLIRQPWVPNTRHLADYITVPVRAENFGNISVDLKQNQDYVTLKPGIQIQVVVTHELTNGSIIVFSDSDINMMSLTTISNEEGTIAYPGEFDTFLYVLG